ncbi:MAG: hypothetical protein ACRCZS_18065 [Chroococcidiopsis sp.]
MRALQTSQIILRTHYLRLVELLDDAVERIDIQRRKVRFCAAKLLEYFRYWCSWVRQHEQRDWYYRKLKQIYSDLMGEHSLHVIRAAIALLEEKGLLKRSNNSNGQDKVYRYQVDNERLEQLLLKENLHPLDPNSENSTGESQTVNLSNQSSSNFSHPRTQTTTETEIKTKESQPAPESSVGKQAVSEISSDIKLRSKTKPDWTQPKPNIFGEDKLSAAVPQVWEVAPNQPYPYFLQWRALHYKNQGGHWADSPLTNAYSEFYKNPAKTNILWQEFLQFYNLALDNALALEAAGIEVRLPSCLSAVPSASPEEVAQKAKTLSNHPQRPRAEIAPVPDFSARLSALVRQRTLPPTLKKQQPTDSLQMYLEWLHGQEPVLVEEARKKLTRLVMERSDLLPDWDERGRLIDVAIVAD